MDGEATCPWSHAKLVAELGLDYPTLPSTVPALSPWAAWLWCNYRFREPIVVESCRPGPRNDLIKGRWDLPSLKPTLSSPSGGITGLVSLVVVKTE